MAYIHAYGLKLICIIRCIASIAIVWSHTEIDDSLFIIIMIIVHVVQKRKKEKLKKVLSTSNSVNHELNIRPSKLNIRES